MAYTDLPWLAHVLLGAGAGGLGAYSLHALRDAGVELDADRDGPVKVAPTVPMSRPVVVSPEEAKHLRRQGIDVEDRRSLWKKMFGGSQKTAQAKDWILPTLLTAGAAGGAFHLADKSMDKTRKERAKKALAAKREELRRLMMSLDQPLEKMADAWLEKGGSFIGDLLRDPVGATGGALASGARSAASSDGIKNIAAQLALIGALPMAAYSGYRAFNRQKTKGDEKTNRKREELREAFRRMRQVPQVTLRPVIR